MLKGGLILVVSGFVSKFLALARSIIIARLVSTEDFGIVSTFLITIALMEMASAFSLDRLIVQDREGDDPDFIGTMHSLTILRGIVAMLGLFVIAGPYAHFMGVSEDLVWAYQVLALAPMMKGLANLDLYRVQRQMRFWPFALWTLGFEGLALVGVAVLLLFFENWQLGLWVILFHQCCFAVLSHLLAERRYHLAWDPVIVRRAIAFGLPLLGNAMILFAVINGDRMIVSNQLGLEQLAYFSVAFGLTMVPMAILARAHQFVFLPMISRHQDDPATFARGARLTIESQLALAILIIVFFNLFGVDSVIILYGEQYAVAGLLLSWMGIMQGMRMARTGATTVALALADTRHSLIANGVRGLSVPVSFGVLAYGGDVITLVIIATVAEFTAGIVSLFLLSRNPGPPLPRSVYPALTAFMVLFCAAVMDLVVFPPVQELFGNYHLSQIGLVLLGLLAAAAMPEFRRWFMESFGKLVRKLRNRPKIGT